MTGGVAMNLNYSREEMDFRDEVRSWLNENLTADLRSKVLEYQHLDKEELLRWHRILAAKGWSVPHWPVEWGGTGWDITQRYIYDEEFGLAGAPMLPPFAIFFSLSPGTNSIERNTVMSASSA
jgi:acyl-CoA dehydrogenase